MFSINIFGYKKIVNAAKGVRIKHCPKPAELEIILKYMTHMKN